MDLKRGIWQCFGCHAKGNVLDFVCCMEGKDPANHRELRQAALKIQRAFFGAGSSSEKGRPPARHPTKTQSICVNEPMDFELQTLDVEHPYLRNRGFTPDTITGFGLGYCNRGMLKGRIAIPLHDNAGRLVGYAGRLVEERFVSEANPKYKFPGDRERGDALLQFRKSLLLYNYCRLPPKVPELIVVEGFTAVWWLTQFGYPNTVALMGSHCSDEQAKLILAKLNPDGRIWLMPDGDDAGVKCAESLLEQLSPHRFVRWVRLHNGEQPTDCTLADLEALLSS